MKKILIVLLSVLLALSFISCEKDKSEEVIANYEEFCKVYKIDNTALSLFSSASTETDLKETSIDTKNLSSFLSALLSSSDITGPSASTNFTSGSYAKKTEGDTTKVTITDAVFKVSYTIGDKNVTDEEYKISGTCVTKNPEDGTGSYDYSLTINGTGYSITMSGEKGKVTSATVNGKAVDVRLLNSQPSFSN